MSDVDARVYGSLLVSFRAAKKEQKLVHDMLELIDSYLWAQKPLATAPQIRYPEKRGSHRWLTLF